MYAMLNFYYENQTGVNTEHYPHMVFEKVIEPSMCINFSVILLNTDNKEIDLQLDGSSGEYIL